MTWTLLDGNERHTLEATTRDERIWIAADALHAALGWQLKPEGLCRGDVCIPVRDRASLVSDGSLDLAAFATLLDRPLACDVGARMAVLGESAGERASALATLEAPDFTLPDLTGQEHSLSQYRGKKVLLVAYASW